MDRPSWVSDDIDQLTLHRSSAAGSSSGTRAGRGAVDFDMPKALKRPRDVSYSVRNDMKRGLININPDYQRDVVWKTEKQMMLIDSVFTNHYMPPIIFSVAYVDNGAEVKKVCLDGKQRLTSLRLFMDGVIPLKHPDTLKNWWYRNDESSSSRTKNILPDRIKTSFVNRQIRCTEYEELDEEDEREIFRRVQLGVALSSAEKLRVLNTCRAKFINELRELFVTEDSLAAPSFRWERSRGADYRCLAQAVYVMYKWSNDNGASLKSAGTLPQIEKWLEEETDAVPEEFATSIKQTFSTMVELTLRKEYSQPFEMYTKVSPVEIIGVLVLIYAHSVIAPPDQRLTLGELSAAVAALRQDVRREHKDIRLNDRVGKTIIGFVKAYRRPAPTYVPVHAAPPPLTPNHSQVAAVDAPPHTPNHSQAVAMDTPPQSHQISYSPYQSQPYHKRKLEVSSVGGRAPKRFPIEGLVRTQYTSFPVASLPTSAPPSSGVSPSLATPQVARNPQRLPSPALNHLIGKPLEYTHAGSVAVPLHSLSYPSPPSLTPTPPSAASSLNLSSYSRLPVTVPPLTIKSEPPESPRVTLRRLKEKQLNTMIEAQANYDSHHFPVNHQSTAE